jgi:hypothetical protein
MRKNFLILMLTTLLPLAGFAQRNVGDIFPADNFVYQVTATMDGSDPGEVTLIGIRDGKSPIVDGALVIPNTMSADLFGDTYTFNVTALGYGALQDRKDATGTYKGKFTGTAAATKIEFPAHITEIPSNCFNGWTNVKSITFAEGSELETINNWAFATTQITKFDFSPCSQLAALPDEVFVEAGAINSYITEITLPEDSKLLKDIQGAFKHLPNLTTIKNLEKSSITQVIANAFDGDAKLTKIELPGTVQTIAANAFKNCGVSDLTINVGSLITAGNGVTQLYGTTAADLNKLTKLTLKGNLGGIITTNAFKGHTNLATLDLSGLNFASLGQIATSAFEGCTKITSLTLGNINDMPAAGSTIDANAFKGCTKLATVTVGNINSANAIGAAAFGNKLKTVTIGTVKAGAASILAGAFVFDNVAAATLKVATGAGQYLSSDDALTPIFGVGAFDFSAIDGSNAGWVDQRDAAVVYFGEIRSKGGVFAGGDVKGDHIRIINFTGDIAQGGLDAQIYDNTANASSLWTINFAGNLATGAIEANAFANLAAKKTIITFSGSLAKEAIMAGAFEGLYGNHDGEKGSQVKLTGTPADATVNPFEINAFGIGANVTTDRMDIPADKTIWLTVTNAELLGRFKSTTKGLKSDGVFDVYRVDFYVAPIPDDNSFLVYTNKNDKKTAWARINFFADQLSATLAGGTKDLKIQRVQTIDGAKAKLTLYGTYTDEDDALNAATIYMVPLKVKDGYYHINKLDDEILIAKVEKTSDFTANSHKVAVSVTGYIGANESLWPGLHNSELYIANNIMTNQQLIDKTASDWYGPVDIYRGGSTIVEDLYIMNDPSKNNGFRIDKTIIEKKTDGTGAYINKGWYYMLLKHYTGSAAAAPRIIWMDDASESDITGILEVKHDVKSNTQNNNAIYTLQGVRVSQTQKGVIYIQNGKKFIAK